MSGELPALVRDRIVAEPATTKKERALQEKIDTFRHQLAEAEEKAGRAAKLAAPGIPPEGAVLLLQRDPLTQGPKLFQQYCSKCHSYGYIGPGLDKFHNADNKTRFQAGDLAGWGTKEWILGLLKDPDHPRYFGHTPFKESDMSGWAADQWSGRDKTAVAKRFEKIAAWLATHPTEAPKKDAPAELREGYSAFLDGRTGCVRCHSFAGGGGGSTSKGPDFTGYGSAEWLRMMITDPHDPLRYGRIGKKRPMNAMPIFRDREAVTWNVQRAQLTQHRNALLKPLLKEVPDDPKSAVLAAEAILQPWPVRLAAFDELMSRAALRKENDANTQRIALATEDTGLSEVHRELIIRWMTGDHRPVFGGEPIWTVRKR
jgi:mono/diheme cytochrome c family protein